MSLSRSNTILLSLGGLAIGAIVFLSYHRSRQIAKVAKAFIGQQEKSGNAGFKNPEMERLMREVGFRSGDAWCVYFVKLMWFTVVPEWLKPKIKTAISGNSQETWAKVSNDPAFVVSHIPRIGDIAIWQNYKNGVGQLSGHAGIVTKVHINDFETVEGNTSTITGTSEGIEVAEKTRTYSFDVWHGLRLKGFVRLA